MKLYGTTTSPFVRRVAVVAAEVGEPVERFDTASEAGQARLREVTPIRKVPVAEIDGRVLFDSRVIIEWIVTTRGWGGVVPPRDRWHEANLLNAIDGTAYAERQLARADAIFAWLVPQLRSDVFGLPEISVVCSLDWLEFRKQYPVERSGLESLRAAWRERPSLAATRPHV